MEAGPDEKSGLLCAESVSLVKKTKIFELVIYIYIYIWTQRTGKYPRTWDMTPYMGRQRSNRYDCTHVRGCEQVGHEKNIDGNTGKPAYLDRPVLVSTLSSQIPGCEQLGGPSSIFSQGTAFLSTLTHH